MPHEHHIVVASVDRSANHIRIGLEARRTVVARQIHRHDVMAFLLQERSKQLPAPGTVPSTVHQGKRRYAVMLAVTGPLEAMKRDV